MSLQKFLQVTLEISGRQLSEVGGIGIVIAMITLQRGDNRTNVS
jgi:hypothetical protein